MIYLFKKLLGLTTITSNYTIDELNYHDSDALISFSVNNSNYLLDLEWDNGVMFIEFRELNDDTFDTTNFFEQYELLSKVHDITYEMSKIISRKTKVKFTEVKFDSSDIRNGNSDKESKKIRDKFFLRYLTKTFPKCKIIENKENITVKLYG